ncbi:MAG TPA: hypothetical protein VMU63_06540 [Acidimicrobiales bacterium]|nr:hypothetical protein [Acidimicrobiales bacterium]
MNRTRWPTRRLVLGVLVVAALGGVAYGLSRAVQAVVGPTSGCTFAGSDGPAYSLDPDQAQEASVIAAVGGRLGLPDHAVTIALATSLQETHLRDLPYGDLDSVGLFQQRPSQGWGSRAQLLDPNYAATAFFQHLEQVPGWTQLAVADAAQAVQHSADGAAYAAWASEARTLAIDLTGEAPASVSCRLTGYQGATPASGALTAAGENELGLNPFGTDPGPQQGWRIAGWLVAHAYAYHLPSVSYQNRMWSADSGRWAAVPSSNPASVQAG